MAKIGPDRPDTRRWRLASLNEQQKLIGGHNGSFFKDIGDKGYEGRAEKKRMRQQARQEILLELAELQLDQKPEQPRPNPIDVPGFVPGQSWSSDWLFPGWHQRN